MKERNTIAAILVAGAMIAYAIQSRPAPIPAPPAPPPDGWPTLDLRGAFVGPNAAEDATTTQCFLNSLGHQLAQDWKKSDPWLKTAAAYDELRRVARDFRMDGQTLGARQPIAKERIAAFLDAAVGTDGGPVDQGEHDRWVRACNDISKAAARAAGR